VLHMTRVPPGMPSVQEEHIFSPAFIAGPTGGAVESKYIRPVLGRDAVCLPSTSPANAAWSPERLTEAWMQVRLAAGEAIENASAGSPGRR